MGVNISCANKRRSLAHIINLANHPSLSKVLFMFLLISTTMDKKLFGLKHVSE